MATQLKNELVFTNIPGGGQSTQPHGLNVQGLELIPDIVLFDNADFDLVSATTTTITVINTGLVAASSRVLVELWHTLERAFGAAPLEYIEQFPNPPFVVRGGGGGGTPVPPVLTGQAFTYVCTGAEGSDFTISLPAAQANDDYIPTVSSGSVYAQLTYDCPDTLIGDRTAAAFRLVTSADVMVGDQIDVLITART